MKRSALLATVAALLIIVTTGCSSGGSGSSSSTSSSAPSTTTTTKAPTPTTISSTHCSSSQLQASLGSPDAGAGQLYVPIVFVNTGTKACELRGFPGVSLLDQNNVQIGQPATREGAEGQTVTLAPNGTASAVLHTTNATGGAGNCTPTSTSVRIYPPDNTEAITIRAEFTACGGFSVATVVAGATGH